MDISDITKQKILVHSKEEALAVIARLESVGCHINPEYSLEDFVTDMLWNWDRGRVIYAHYNSRIDHSPYVANLHSGNIQYKDFMAMFAMPVVVPEVYGLFEIM